MPIISILYYISIAENTYFILKQFRLNLF